MDSVLADNMLTALFRNAVNAIGRFEHPVSEPFAQAPALRVPVPSKQKRCIRRRPSSDQSAKKQRARTLRVYDVETSRECAEAEKRA